MHKPSTREAAVTLRRQGYSYPYISAQTGLSKSTLSGWLTNVPYAPNKVTIDAFGKARAAASKKKALERLNAVAKIRTEAAFEIANISKRDLFMFGLGLYLGEGAKTHNGTSIANADPKVMRLAVGWFRDLGIETYQFSPRMHIYPDNDPRACLRFWSGVLEVPESQFQKTYIDKRTDKKYKKKGKLPFGTLHLSVRGRGKVEHGVALFHRIQAWNEAVLQKIDKMRD